MLLFSHVIISRVDQCLGLGASLGSLRAGTALGVCTSINSSLGVSGILPLIMAGILSVYGLIVAVFISGSSNLFIDANGCFS